MAKRQKNEQTRKALAEFLNLTFTEGASAYRDAEKFLRTHKRLTPESAMPEADAIEYAQRLRDVWDTTNGRSRSAVTSLWTAKHRIDAANGILNDLFRAGDPIKNEGPAVAADVKGRGVKPMPRTFLHELALELLYFPKSIGKCRTCGRFFVKTSSRDSYCPPKFNQDGAKIRECYRSRRNLGSKNGMRALREKRKRYADAKRPDRKN